MWYVWLKVCSCSVGSPSLQSTSATLSASVMTCSTSALSAQLIRSYSRYSHGSATSTVSSIHSFTPSLTTSSDVSLEVCSVAGDKPRDFSKYTTKQHRGQGWFSCLGAGAAIAPNLSLATKCDMRHCLTNSKSVYHLRKFLTLSWDSLEIFFEYRTMVSSRPTPCTEPTSVRTQL